MSTLLKRFKIGDRVSSRVSGMRGEIVGFLGFLYGPDDSRSCGVRVDDKVRTTEWIREDLLEMESPVETLSRCLNAD